MKRPVLKTLVASLIAVSAGSAGAECIGLEGLGTTAGQPVDLPALQFLDIAVMRGAGDGQAAIEQYPLLPGGGIDGAQLCGLVEAMPFRAGRLAATGARAGEVVLAMTLQLSQGLDVARTYPSFGKDIARTGQLWQAPAARYVAWQLSGERDRAFTRESEAIARGGTCAGMAIRAGNTLLVPICP